MLTFKNSHVVLVTDQLLLEFHYALGEEAKKIVF